jgi:hypothetical protein
VCYCYSDTLTSYIDENGKQVWVNSGQGNIKKNNDLHEQQIAQAANAINARHPEILSNDNLLNYFLKLRDHFVQQGQPLHNAMLLAEQEMLRQGRLTNSRQTQIHSRPSVSAPAPTRSAIESKIEDEFEGWDGETVVRLTNGQIWQQTEYYYHYHYSYMPDVLIYNSGGGWKMQVKGIKKAVRVERLK